MVTNRIVVGTAPLSTFQVLEGVTETCPCLQSVTSGDPRIGELTDQSILLLGCPMSSLPLNIHAEALVNLASRYSPVRMR